MSFERASLDSKASGWRAANPAIAIGSSLCRTWPHSLASRRCGSAWRAGVGRGLLAGRGGSSATTWLLDALDAAATRSLLLLPLISVRATWLLPLISVRATWLLLLISVRATWLLLLISVRATWLVNA